MGGAGAGPGEGGSKNPPKQQKVRGLRRQKPAKIKEPGRGNRKGGEEKKQEQSLVGKGGGGGEGRGEGSGESRAGEGKVGGEERGGDGGTEGGR